MLGLKPSYVGLGAVGDVGGGADGGLGAGAGLGSVCVFAAMNYSPPFFVSVSTLWITVILILHFITVDFQKLNRKTEISDRNETTNFCRQTPNSLVPEEYCVRELALRADYSFATGVCVLLLCISAT